MITALRAWCSFEARHVGLKVLKWCCGVALNVNYLDNKYPDVDDGPGPPWSAPDVSIIGWWPALVSSASHHPLYSGHAIKASSPVRIIKILPRTCNGNILCPGYLGFNPAWSNIYPDPGVRCGSWWWMQSPMLSLTSGYYRCLIYYSLIITNTRTEYQHFQRMLQVMTF